MSVWEQLRLLITNQDLTTQTSAIAITQRTIPRSEYIPDFLLRYWYTKTPQQQRSLLLQLVLLFSISFYIVSPSLPLSRNKDKMFTKRPDKHTTGLINLRNDCFANSSLQAYSSLPAWTEYLNEFIHNFKKLKKFMNDRNIDINEIIKLRLERNPSLKHSKFKLANSKFDIPLHFAMAQIIKKLQETQLSSRTISVWTFLHELEGIFNAKISRSQHDAHELTQLINETLDNENLLIKSFHEFISSNLQTVMKTTPTPQDYAELVSCQIPDFPFDGLILNQMTCFSCKGVSKPNFTPFSMLTLNPPQAPVVQLDTLLGESESDSIEGYQCLKCRVNRIVANEQTIKRRITDPDEIKYIKEINRLCNDPTFCINEDLPEDLEAYIKNYNINGVKISLVTSTVYRKSQILKPPKIFGIHLSRSAFDGQEITRNQCLINFNDYLTLSIGEEYTDTLKQFQSSIPKKEVQLPEDIKSPILTTDVNDMEDEAVQREDIDETAKYGEVCDIPESNVPMAKKKSHLLLAEDLDLEFSDTASQSDLESSTEFMTSTSSVYQNFVQHPSQTSSLASITEKQSEDLRKIFGQFKFNDDDVYSYRLKALIRHMGSHTQGHYECYKRKPLYVKDRHGNIFKLFPEIIDDSSDENIAEPTHEPIEIPAYLINGDNPATKKHSNLSRSSSSATAMENANTTSEDSFRSKLSNMIARRPSVFQADPENVEEIIRSGTHSPAELLVEDPMQQMNQQQILSEEIKQALDEKLNKKTKMKKINSVVSNPFWRISDAKISECSKAYVLAEGASVYMLFYERVDRKQVKKHAHHHHHLH